MKKLVSVVMSIVLAIGLMPLPAYAETSDGLAVGSVDDAASATASDGSSASESLSLESIAASISDAASIALAAQAGAADGRYETKDPSRGGTYSMEYDKVADEKGEIGLVVRHISIDSGDADVVVPSHIADDEGNTYPVVALGYDRDNGFTWYRSDAAKTVTIPATVKTISHVYFNAAGSGGVFFEEGSPITEMYPSIFGSYGGASVSLPDGLVIISDNMFERAYNLESIALPSAAKSIGERAFNRAEKLTSVTMNDKLETIGKEAFAHVPGTGFDGYGGGYYYNDFPHITSLAFPNSLTSIDDAAFRKVYTLGDVSFGTSPQAANLRNIGDRAFFGTAVKSVVIPDSVESIGAEAFSGVYTNEFDDKGNPKGLGGYDGESTAFSEDAVVNGQTLTYHALTNLQLGSSQEASQLKILGARAFARQPITSVTLPNSLITLGYTDEDHGWYSNGFASHAVTDQELSPYLYDDNHGPKATKGAFSGCDKLETIVWPTQPGLNTIGGFDGCGSLAADTIDNIPAWVSTIDDYAFYNCVKPGSIWFWPGYKRTYATTNLMDVTVPVTVTKIGKAAFSKSDRDEYKFISHDGNNPGGASPVYTILNPNVDLDWGEGEREWPWPAGDGYTIRYPASASADSDIVKYRAMVEAYEAEQAKNRSNYDYTCFIAVPDAEYQITGTVPAGATVQFLVDGVTQDIVDGPNFQATAEEGAQVAAIVELDGYAPYTVAPEGGALTQDWTFTVSQQDLTPLSDTGTLMVTVKKDRSSVDEAFRAAIGVNVLLFDAAGRLVEQAATPTSGMFVAEGLAPGAYTVVAFDGNEWFNTVSGVDDFAKMGVAAGSWATQSVAIAASQTTEIDLPVPDLKVSAQVGDVLDTGNVVVNTQRLVPDYTFYARVDYTMKDGRTANKVQVSIPAGLQPVSAATTRNAYGVDGWDAKAGILTVEPKGADTSSAALNVGLKAVEPGIFSISASVTSGAVTAPLGAAEIDAQALTLVAPTDELAKPTFDVDVYAAPGSVVGFTIGNTKLSITATTNQVGHGKATLIIPDSELGGASYLGFFQLTATLNDGVGAGAVQTRQMEYRSNRDEETIVTEQELSFQHAGQKVYLVKDGKNNDNVYYMCVMASHIRTENQNEWPFTSVFDSARPLGENAMITMKALDGTMLNPKDAAGNDVNLKLTGTQDVGGGVVRYTYQGVITIGEGPDDAWLDASEIPYAFEVIPEWASDEAPISATSQATVDAFKATKRHTPELWKQTASQDVGSALTAMGVQPGKEADYWYQYAPKSYAALKAMGEDPDTKDAFNLFFNRYYKHENWDPKGDVWNTLSADDRQLVLEFEQAMEDYCVWWQEFFGDNKPLYEYANITEYLEDNFGFKTGQKLDPKELEAQGYEVIYDRNAQTGECEWYAVMSETTVVDDEWDEMMQGQSADGTDEAEIDLAAQAGGSGSKGKKTKGKTVQGRVKAAKSDGTVIDKTIQWWNDQSAESKISQILGPIGTVVTAIDVKAAASTSAFWKDISAFGSKCVGAAGCAVSLVVTVYDNLILDAPKYWNRYHNINRDLRELMRKKKMYESQGKTGTKCYQALMTELSYLRKYDAANSVKIAVSVADTVATSELAAFSVANPETGVLISAASAGAGTAWSASSYFLGNAASKSSDNAKATYDRKTAARKKDCGEKQDPKHKTRVGIDPSGFVYSGDKDNRLEGVTATIYQKVDGQWVKWDAEDWDQVNDQVTGSEGLFGWEVPAGTWKVVFTVDGFDGTEIDLGNGTDPVVSSAFETPNLDVPPEWTDIAVKLLVTSDATQPMYRLYNPYSGEHFYTSDANERDDVVAHGWNDEGVGWIAPLDGLGQPVYRLYNKYGGEHHYTLDAKERDNLIAAGWNDEGVGWYSYGQVGLYREYNPYAFANNHNYTTDKSEHEYLVSIGWKDECENGKKPAWYAVAAKPAEKAQALAAAGLAD